MEREFKEINDALNVSGNANIVRPPWFTYVEDLRAGSAAVDPHVVDGGGAAEDHADPNATMEPPSTATATQQVPVVQESVTMTGAKLIADTLKACNQEGLAKLDQITALIMNAVAAASAAPEAASANVGQADPTTPTVTLDHGDPTSLETCNMDYTYTPSSEETAAPTDMGPTNGEATEFQQ
ncbi:unnamed protein product [Closterium sp. NIES-65]|nr:unnamed protein product [Closterium sp. NIES-65]